MTKAAELAKMGEVLTNSQIGGRRNIIINGAMQINQRGSVTFNHNTTATANVYGCDRFQFQSSALDQLEGTITQVADAPVGFTNSLKWTTTEPETSIASTQGGEEFNCCQKIEAQDLQQLAYGTSSAKKLTLRFYVKSSVTGTYGINVFKGDTTLRQLTSTYTISSADTWEEKTFTFPGDTDSGATIANDNGEGLRITWQLAAGSNKTTQNNALTWTDYADAGWAFGHAQNGVATTDNATWQLTGVQLEVGEQATPFEHRSFGEELALCQRYFETGHVESVASFITGTVVLGNIFFRTTKRANPTVAFTTAFGLYVNGTTPTLSTNTVNGTPDIDTFVLRANSSTSNAGKAGHFRDGVYTADSEL